MLSFVPKADLQQVSAGQPFSKFIHRSFVKLDPATTTVGEVLRTAQQKLQAFLQQRAAYRGEPVPQSEIVAVWAFTSSDGVCARVAMPLTSRDYLLNDAVVGRTWESKHGALPPPDDGMLFSVLPPDLSIDMLMSMDADDRHRLLEASQNMKRVWGSYVWFELPSSELFFEVSDV